MQEHVGEGLPDAQRFPATWDKTKPHFKFVLGRAACINMDEFLENENTEIGDKEILHRAGDIEIEADAIAFNAGTRSHIKFSVRGGNGRSKGWSGILDTLRPASLRIAR